MPKLKLVDTQELVGFEYSRLRPSVRRDQDPGGSMRYALPVVLAVAACAALTIPTHSTAQTASPPSVAQPTRQSPLAFRCPSPGTIVRIGQRTITHRGADPSDAALCRFVSSSNAVAVGELWNFWSVPGNELDQKRAVLAELWPAHVGRSVDRTLSLKESGTNIVTLYREQWTVKGIEPLTIPAGTFQTLVFERTQTGQGSNTYQGSWRYHYDVATRALLKRSYTHLRGKPPSNQDWEASELIRPD